MAALEGCTAEESVHVGAGAGGIEGVTRWQVRLVLEKSGRGGVVGLTQHLGRGLSGLLHFL
jgi:hypothetical protein